jgi:hypothetical protein
MGVMVGEDQRAALIELFKSSAVEVIGLTDAGVALEDAMAKILTRWEPQ